MKKLRHCHPMYSCLITITEINMHELAEFM